MLSWIELEKRFITSGPVFILTQSNYPKYVSKSVGKYNCMALIFYKSKWFKHLKRQAKFVAGDSLKILLLVFLFSLKIIKKIK